MTPVTLSQQDFDALLRDLEQLRERHRAQFADSLRDARTHGSPGENDDVLTVVGAAAIDEARIARLEDVVRTASVVDDHGAFDGRAGLGCTVQVRDGRGRHREYRLIGRRSAASAPDEVSLASPVGTALAGARAGDIVRVTLPNGREREMQVVAVLAACEP